MPTPYMRRYHFRPEDAQSYERHQHNPDTALVWCIHLHVDTLLQSAATLSAIESFGPIGLLTYEYFEGSWSQWGESLHPDADETGWSLVVYFRSLNRERAWENGCWIADQLHLTPEQFGVTTAGDWSRNVQPRDTAPLPDDGWLDVARAVGVLDE